MSVISINGEIRIDDDEGESARIQLKIWESRGGIKSVNSRNNSAAGRYFPIYVPRDD